VAACSSYHAASDCVAMALGVSVKAAGTAPVVQLYGDVGFDILAVDVALAMESAGGRDVTVNLFSYGGDAGEGIAIHDILARYQGRKTVVIDGVAASAGSIVAMAGDRVVMPENALLMIHNCWSMAAGDAESLRTSATLLDTYSAAYRRTYAQRTGATEEQVTKWMSAGSGAGTWFTAEDALAAGLVDEVAAPAQVRASAPRLPADRFTSPPAALLQTWGAKDDKMSQEDRILPPSPFPMTTQSPVGVAPPAATADDQAMAAATHEAAPVTPPTIPSPVAASSESATVLALRRENDIRRCAAKAGLSAEAVQAMVDSGKPFAEVAVDIVAAHASAVEGRAGAAGHPARIQVTRHEGDTVMAGIGDMLYARINPGHKLSDAGKQYRGFSLMECVRIYAESRGISTVGRSKSELTAMAMHSTSDFPLLFSNLAGKALDAAYEEEPHTYKQIARQRNLPDFKQTADLVMAADILPELTLEGGEYKSGTVQEAQSTWRLFTYTKKIVIGRQAIINDDLSALERVPEYMGRGFRRLESNLVWALISGNVVTSVDNQVLFHASHNNTGTGAIGIAGVNSAKKAMRKQTDISGATVNLTPDFLIVPTDLEGTALQFLYPTGYAPAALTGAAGPNVYAGSMQLIVEPRLDGSAAQWYAAAGPNRIDGLVYGYLADEPGPTITPVPERDPDGITLLARTDFGCAVKDYRFIYRSSGV
jgi:ATP-dependent protease ClpP protease subunit